MSKAEASDQISQLDSDSLSWLISLNVYNYLFQKLHVVFQVADI